MMKVYVSIKLSIAKLDTMLWGLIRRAFTLLIHSGNFEVMEVDINGDGTIDFEEFLGMMKSKANEADQESDLREAFKIFDRDKDGYIDMKELKKVTNNLDQHEF